MRRVRAEWEKHSVVLMAFPHSDTDWGDDLPAAYSPFVRIAQAIAYSQPVYILCKNKEEIADFFCSHTNMSFIELPFNDTWTRDYGPITVEEDGKRILLDFTFDGWGGKFKATRDNSVNRALHKKGYFGITPLETIDLVLEGGSIESDGAGTILTTTECLCNPNRNSGLSKEEVEEKLKKYLGTQRVLWLDHGYLAGDDTDAHIDTLVRFVNQESIMYVACDNEEDEHYTALKAMEEQLYSFRTAEGNPYRLIPLPMCDAIYDEEGRRLPATYANFLITNDALIYPTYGTPQDKTVHDIFAEHFSDREIIPVNCRKLIEQGGSLHCSTIQVAY